MQPTTTQLARRLQVIDLLMEHPRAFLDLGYHDTCLIGFTYREVLVKPRGLEWDGVVICPLYGITDADYQDLFMAVGGKGKQTRLWAAQYLATHPAFWDDFQQLFRPFSEIHHPAALCHLFPTCGFHNNGPCIWEEV